VSQRPTRLERRWKSAGGPLLADFVQDLGNGRAGPCPHVVALPMMPTWPWAHGWICQSRADVAADVANERSYDSPAARRQIARGRRMLLRTATGAMGVAVSG